MRYVFGMQTQHVTQNGWDKNDIIAQILVDFKGVSVENGGNCVYRGANGLKCAVGIFIPDSEYERCFDDRAMSARNLIRDYSLNGFMPLDVDGMSTLQQVHDHYVKNCIGQDEDCLVAMIDWIETNVKDGK